MERVYGRREKETLEERAETTDFRERESFSRQQSEAKYIERERGLGIGREKLPSPHPSPVEFYWGVVDGGG